MYALTSDPYCSIAGVNVSVLGLIVRSPGCEALSGAVFCIDSGDFFFSRSHFFSPGSVIGENGEEKTEY